VLYEMGGATAGSKERIDARSRANGRDPRKVPGMLLYKEKPKPLNGVRLLLHPRADWRVACLKACVKMSWILLVAGSCTP
jgi:hypothetical protein